MAPRQSFTNDIKSQFEKWMVEEVKYQFWLDDSNAVPSSLFLIFALTALSIMKERMEKLLSFRQNFMANTSLVGLFSLITILIVPSLRDKFIERILRSHRSKILLLNHVTFENLPSSLRDRIEDKLGFSIPFHIKLSDVHSQLEQAEINKATYIRGVSHLLHQYGILKTTGEAHQLILDYVTVPPSASLK